MDVNKITEQTIGAAMAVHRALGPGLLESAYEERLYPELSPINFNVPALKRGVKRIVNNLVENSASFTPLR